MSPLEPHPDGTILPVRANPGARRNEIRGFQDGQLKVYVTQAPEKGKANKALVALLARELAVRRSQIELVGGKLSPNKRFLIRGLTPKALLRKLERSQQTSGRSG